MKNPIEIWNELEPLGKWTCWIVMPIYYITIMILYGAAILLAGIINAWDDFE